MFMYILNVKAILYLIVARMIHPDEGKSIDLSHFKEHLIKLYFDKI